MRNNFLLVCLLSASIALPAHAGFSDWVKGLLGGNKSKSSQSHGLTTSEVVRGLKEALSNGARSAIERLGREGGFLNDVRVRIPVPGKLRKLEKIMRRLGMRKYADRFVVSMNRAAEKAVTEAGPIFWKAIKQMSFRDAMAILRGSDHAATDYFRRKTSGELIEKLLPLIRRSTAEVGVTRYYKKFVHKLPYRKRYLSDESIDLDQYITRKALDGLFLMIASEEARIRKNPVARTTSILKKVFGGK